MKKFEQLLINSIDEEITGTTVERLTKAKAIFESEMINPDRVVFKMGDEMRRLYTTQRLQDWLQGLCSTVSVPFMNHDIIAWYEEHLGRKAKNDTECYNWLDKYWPQCARTLYSMLYN